MICYVREGQIYDRGGNEITPDENGIVVLNLEDKPRRFVKDKLIDWLKRNNKLIPPPKIKQPPPPRKKPVQKVKRERPKKYKIHKVRKVRTDFTRKGFKITAKKGDVVFGPYISISACAKAISISKSQISKVLRGESTTNTGFEFSKI